jgi:hypothetical protein
MHLARYALIFLLFVALPDEAKAAEYACTFRDMVSIDRTKGAYRAEDTNYLMVATKKEVRLYRTQSSGESYGSFHKLSASIVDFKRDDYWYAKSTAKDVVNTHLLLFSHGFLSITRIEGSGTATAAGYNCELL